MKLMNMLLLSTFVLFCASCKKSTTDKNDNYKVKSITYSVNSSSYNSTHTVNIVYDPDGKMIASESVTYPGTKTVYEVSGGKNSYKYYSNNVLAFQSDAFVDFSTSLVDSTYEINTSLKDTTSSKYYYNSAKQLIKAVRVQRMPGGIVNSFLEYEYDDAGNVMKEIENFDGNIYARTYIYAIVVPVVIVAPAGYTPVIHKQMPTKVEFRGLGTNYDVLHSYTFDASGRVSTDVSTFSDRDQVHTTTYTYY